MTHANGRITLQFNTVKDNAQVNAIEILSWPGNGSPRGTAAGIRHRPGQCTPTLFSRLTTNAVAAVLYLVV